MIFAYILLITFIIVSLASAVPFVQYLSYRLKKRKNYYTFSDELYNRDYLDIRESKDKKKVMCFDQMKELEYSIELP